MILIDEIINILSSDTGTLTDALIKTKVLLHKIGHKELVDWVNSELNGYPDKNLVPPYRTIGAQVLVNAANMAYQFNSHPIPLGHLSKEHREDLEIAKLDQSLSVLEQFTLKDDGHLQAPIPMEANRVLERGLANGYKIQRAWCEIQVADVTSVLTQVRSRLLDFILELSDQITEDMSDKELREKGGTLDAENLFNNAIFGDNTTIQLGSGNSQSVTINNTTNDFDALSDVLNRYNVSTEDVDTLKAAIDEDDQLVDNEAKEYGPAVKVWLQTMLSKAVDTSWNIELGVASSLLATALQNYYGWL